MARAKAERHLLAVKNKVYWLKNNIKDIKIDPPHGGPN